MEKKGVIILILILLILMMISNIAVRAKEDNLKLNLKIGESYPLQIEIIQSLEQDFFGNKMTIKQKLITKNNYYLKAIDEKNNYILVVKYDDLKLELLNLGGNFGGVKEEQFKNKFNTSMKEATASIKGKEFIMKISPNAKILSMKGYQKLINKWQETIEYRQQKQGMARGVGIENFFTEEFMEQLWENILAYIPQQPVEIGSSWSNDFKLTDPFAIVINNNYTLSKITAQKKIINTQAPIEIQDLTLNNQTGNQIVYNLTGKQQGKVILNRRTNWIQKAELNFIAKGTMGLESAVMEGEVRMPIACFINVKLSNY